MTLIKARNKFVRMSPRKIRQLVDHVKALSPAMALSQLEFVPKAAALPLAKTIRQAIANASHNLKIDQKSLKFKEIFVDDGKAAKRADKSHGSRFDRGIIKKKNSHITVILESR